MNFFHDFFKRISDVKKKNLLKEIRGLERQIRYYKAEANLLEQKQVDLLGIEGKGILYNPTTYLQTFIDEYKEKIQSLEFILEQKRKKYKSL